MTEAKKREPTTRDKLIGWAVIGVVLIGAWWWFIGRPDDSQEQAEDQPHRDLVGAFLRWEAVDDAHGFAHFTITNNGDTSAVAECTVRVSNDFGEFGFDSLIGETVPAGDTVSLRMPLDVGEGALLVNEGEVTDC